MFYFFCFLQVVDCIFSIFFWIPLPPKNSSKYRECYFFVFQNVLYLNKKSQLPARGRKKHVFLHKNLDVLCLHQEIRRDRRKSFLYSSYSSLQWLQLVRVMCCTGWPWVALGGPGWPCPALCPGKPWEALGSPGQPWEALGNPERPWEALGSPGKPCALCPPVPCVLCPVPPCALCLVQLSSCRVMG